MFAIGRRTSDYFRYSLLASDPGLQQVKQGAKTVLAVVITLLVFHALRPEIALFAGICAGFMMQCTAGTERRDKQKMMFLMGVGVVFSTGLGNALAAHDWIKDVLLAAVAFTVYYVRRFLPGKAMFPLFGFTLTLLATLRPGAALLYMGAAAGSAATAFLVYFYVLPDETPLAFRHAFNLFLFHARRLRKNPRSRKDLRVLHAAVAFSQGEARQLCHLAPDLCDQVLTDQYEALQVLTILTDTALEAGSDEARRATVAFCELEYDRLAPDLAAHRELLEAR